MRVEAVILVGRGSSSHRSGRGGAAVPALEAVANRPIIQHVLDEFRAAEVGRVIVAGEAEALIAVRGCLDSYGDRGRQLECVICQPGFDMAAALRLAAPLVGDSPCFVQPADGLLGEPVASVLHSLSYGGPDLILPMADLTSAGGHDDWPATRLAGHASSRRDGTTAEVAVFGAGGLKRAVDVVGPTERADLALIAERLAAAGGSVRYQLNESWRRYTGDGSDLLELNRVALDMLVGDVRPSLRGENRIEGRVSIHPTASARTSVIVGPAVIGRDARIENAYIGPYTSVGAGAQIEGAEIERSIISPGASVTHVGGRLVSSLVGRHARVFRDFSLPRAMRLWVGDGDEIALC